MGKRKMLSIGEQTGIKELDNITHCGFSYNLKEVAKLLNIDKYEMKKICKNFEVEFVNGEAYVDLFQLKKLLLRHNHNLSDSYLGYVVHNDTELQEYGIVYDQQFMEDEDNSELLNSIREYRKQEIDYEEMKENNYLSPLDQDYMDYRELTEEDIEKIYKIIDEN